MNTAGHDRTSQAQAHHLPGRDVPQAPDVEGPLPAQTPIDLTGCTARMQVRPEVESSTVLLELTTANGGITLGGVAGTIELFVSDDDSAAFTWQSGSWDLEIEFPGGDVRRLAQGTVNVSPEVTRV